MDLIFYVAALICFFVAAFGISAGRFNLVAVGLFLWLFAAAF